MFNKNPKIDCRIVLVYLYFKIEFVAHGYGEFEFERSDAASDHRQASSDRIPCEEDTWVNLPEKSSVMITPEI